jgi:hypothetical protein
MRAPVYAVIRCLGFDNALLSLPDSQVTWKNTYEKVLQVYSKSYDRKISKTVKS